MFEVRCSNCQKITTNVDYVETRDGRMLCKRCAEDLNFCEICGSTLISRDQNPDEQLHYEEECFK